MDFSGAVFTRAHFQKLAQISILYDFHYIGKGIPSLVRFWLLITLVMQIWLMRIFARQEKTHEPRTRCIHLANTWQKFFTFQSLQ